jgi:hypothetical protein
MKVEYVPDLLYVFLQNAIWLAQTQNLLQHILPFEIIKIKLSGLLTLFGPMNSGSGSSTPGFKVYTPHIC